MLAARNLKRLRFGQTRHRGALFSCFLGLHRTADDERDGWVQEDESKTKSNVGEKVDNHRQYKKAKEKKERNIARTFKHEDNFHYFLIPRSLAFGAADKREGCHVIFVIFIQWARCKWLQMLSYQYLILYIGCVFLFCAEWRYLNSRNKQEMNSILS